MSNSSFKIEFTDSTVNKKEPFLLSPNSINQSTSLPLYGRGTDNFGVGLWSNLLRMMEHFCSEIEPTNPTEGQLWYNPSIKTLKLYSTDGASYKWFDLYVNNPTSDSPKIELDALSLEKINQMVSLSGADMIGPLNVPLEMFGPDGKPLATTPATATNAATRSYVDAMISDAIKETYLNQMGSTNSTDIYSTVGNLTVLQGQTSPTDTTRTTKLYYTDHTHYGNIFEVDVLFPVAVTPFEIDSNQMPKYTITVTCELKSDDAALNAYLKTLTPMYPVEIINKTPFGCTFKTTVGLIHDDITLNRNISLMSFKYSLTGNKA